MSYIGCTNKFKHTTSTGDTQLTCQGARHIPVNQRAEVVKLVQEMLDKDIISSSSSPWFWFRRRMEVTGSVWITGT